MDRKGFALLEIIIVIGIIALLGGGGLYIKSIQNREDAAQAGTDEIQKARDAVDQFNKSANLSAGTASSTVGETTTIKTTPIKNMNHLITLKTSLGDIQFETYDADAPKTVENFITLAQKGFYNNIIFHRVIEGFMIQGGDPTGTGRGGPGYAFADELNPATASYKEGYKKGVVAMANSGPNTNGSQFFIMLADTNLPKNYSIFGKVVSGQDVVDKIGALPTDPGDRPLDPPVIKSVTVAEK